MNAILFILSLCFYLNCTNIQQEKTMVTSCNSKRSLSIMVNGKPISTKDVRLTILADDKIIRTKIATDTLVYPCLNAIKDTLITINLFVKEELFVIDKVYKEIFDMKQLAEYKFGIDDFTNPKIKKQYETSSINPNAKLVYYLIVDPQESGIGRKFIRSK
jgi:hypothetical protein